ncbi:hypothetical protein KAU55_07085 [Candidatus Bathyarchaeota archaeon]|nr:hypothetical protein [Candidatus Bathyarchaeota archaeon]
MKTFYEEGKLERRWIEEYCMGDYTRCVRYELEETGIPHPDNMLPNGEMMKSVWRDSSQESFKAFPYYLATERKWVDWLS